MFFKYPEVELSHSGFVFLLPPALLYQLPSRLERRFSYTYHLFFCVLSEIKYSVRHLIAETSQLVAYTLGTMLLIMPLKGIPINTNGGWVENPVLGPFLSDPLYNLFCFVF